jgi:hypothetical protein
MTNVAEKLTSSVITHEAVSSSETSANIYLADYTAQHPEDCHLHTRRLENLTSHLVFCFVLNLQLRPV